MSAHILLVEDTEDLGEMIRDILSIQGYEVSWATNGFMGLDVFHKRRPDLLITDVVMPELTGLELIRMIRSLEGEIKIPVIILSARTSAEDQAIGLEAGANINLKKPCSSTDLLEAVQLLLAPQKSVKD